MSAHGPIAELVGGPFDGTVQYCPLMMGFLPNEFEPYSAPEGRYVLEHTVTHADGSLCGGIFRWNGGPR